MHTLKRKGHKVIDLKIKRNHKFVFFVFFIGIGLFSLGLYLCVYTNPVNNAVTQNIISAALLFFGACLICHLFHDCYKKEYILIAPSKVLYVKKCIFQTIVSFDIESINLECKEEEETQPFCSDSIPSTRFYYEIYLTDKFQKVKIATRTSKGDADILFSRIAKAMNQVTT